MLKIVISLTMSKYENFHDDPPFFIHFLNMYNYIIHFGKFQEHFNSRSKMARLPLNSTGDMVYPPPTPASPPPPPPTPSDLAVWHSPCQNVTLQADLCTTLQSLAQTPNHFGLNRIDPFKSSSITQLALVSVVKTRTGH